MLFSRRPVEELDGAPVLLTASSRTSVLLLELLCRHRWRVAPRLATVRAEAVDLAHLQGFPHDAVLVIGDAALHLAAAGEYPYLVDLGTAWKEWTGLPFVFAVWAARAGVPTRQLSVFLEHSLEAGIADLDEIAREASLERGLSMEEATAYFTRHLRFWLGTEEIAGLREFYRRAAREGLTTLPEPAEEAWSALLEGAARGPVEALER
jgi:chorismate dehydratase